MFTSVATFAARAINASCSRVQCIIGWKGVGVTTCTGQGGSGYTTGSAQCSVYGTMRCSAVWGISLLMRCWLGMREQGPRSANHLLHHNEEGDIMRENKLARKKS